MSDPLPLEILRPAAEPVEDRNFHLWRDAPGWRNLTLAAIGLSAALIVLPLAGTPSAEESNNDIAACHGNAAAFAGPFGAGASCWIPDIGSSSQTATKYAIFVAHGH